MSVLKVSKTFQGISAERSVIWCWYRTLKDAWPPRGDRSQSIIRPIGRLFQALNLWTVVIVLERDLLPTNNSRFYSLSVSLIRMFFVKKIPVLPVVYFLFESSIELEVSRYLPQQMKTGLGRWSDWTLQLRAAWYCSLLWDAGGHLGVQLVLNPWMKTLLHPPRTQKDRTSCLSQDEYYRHTQPCLRRLWSVSTIWKTK